MQLNLLHIVIDFQSQGMKKILALFVFLSMCMCLVAQQAPNNNVVGPKIKFSETTYNFGTVEEGVYAKHSFKFYNVGDKPLLLKNVKPGCGCTASDWPREPIMPGDSAIITAKFNSRGYAGRSFHKSIAVTTNLAQNNIRVLYIKGFVRKPLTLEQKPEVISPLFIKK